MLLEKKNEEYWKHDMKTKIYQVKPTRNIVMINIIGQIKTQWIDYI